MHFDPRSLLLFGTNALLIYLTLLVNSSLAGGSLYLFMLGPMLVIPALYLRHISFLICMLLSGLWVDAALPSAYGLFTLSFIGIGTLIFLMRVRFRPENNYHPILLAHTCNFALLLIVTLIEGYAYLKQPSFWIHVLVTALLSHGALLVVAPWYFNLQRLLFDICHLETEPEDLPIT